MNHRLQDSKPHNSNSCETKITTTCFACSFLRACEWQQPEETWWDFDRNVRRAFRPGSIASSIKIESARPTAYT